VGRAYQGKAKVLEYFACQAQTTPLSVDIHDILGNDDRVVVLRTGSATAAAAAQKGLLTLLPWGWV
jgi:hypothetical protein